jgi:hypothetical protein
MTQEDAALLKDGDLVDVWWFSPRKDKHNPDAKTREYGGRTEYLELVWRNVPVKGEPYMTASDGYLVPVLDPNDKTVKHFLASRMSFAEKVQT